MTQPIQIRIHIDGQDIFLIENGIVTLCVELPKGYQARELQVYFDGVLVYAIDQEQGVLCDLVDFKKLIAHD